jgi:hypothetical protein
MAQQGSLYAENSSWFVRYWEIVRQPDGSLKRKRPVHRFSKCERLSEKIGGHSTQEPLHGEVE